jgi:hypothetical protein
LVGDFVCPFLEDLLRNGKFGFAVFLCHERQIIRRVFVAAHATGVWTFVVVEGAFVVACVRQNGEVFAVAKSHEARFFPVNFLLDNDGPILKVGHEVVKKLFSGCKVVSPDANPLARGWLVRFYNGLVLEFVKPFVNGFLGVVSALVILGIEDFEAGISFGHDFLEEQALRHFADFYGVLLFGADNGYARAFLDLVACAFDYGFFWTHYGKVDFRFVGFGELAYCVSVQVRYYDVFGGFFDIEGVALLIRNVQIYFVVSTSAQSVNHGDFSCPIRND